jgi:hypothetical protein
MTNIYIKSIQDREILFGSLADVELYNAIRCDRHDLTMDEALEKYCQFPLGDALVSGINLKFNDSGASKRAHSLGLCFTLQ